MILTSSELATIEQIDRPTGMSFLAKEVRTRDVFGVKITTTRHRRGPGAAVDLVNYGLIVAGKPRAVIRFSPAPFGNAPVIAAIGQPLARHGAYLMRLAGVGISSEDLVTFVRSSLLKFRADQLRKERDFRYIVSLEEPKGWLIDGIKLFEAPAYAGKVYQTAGALSAGRSKTKTQPTRYVDQVGQVHSVYRGGQNMHQAGTLPAGARLVESGSKQRYVFVLAPANSLEYKAWRAVLPAHVVELAEDEGLNILQPRLLADIFPDLSPQERVRLYEGSFG